MERLGAGGRPPRGIMLRELLAESDSVFLAQLGGDPPITLSMQGPGLRSSRVFPTDVLQKGLLVRRGSDDLCGEGMGLGLPVVVWRDRSIFPGRVVVGLDPRRPDGVEPVQVTAEYDLCMRQSLFLAGRTRIESERFYRLRERLSRPGLGGSWARALRALAARLLMRIGRVTLDYEEYESAGTITVRMAIDPAAARVDVLVDTITLRLPGATVTYLNELDGRLFDHYLDSQGAELKEEAIGIWDLVDADQAWLGAPRVGLGFGISGVRHGVVYRGRETSDPTLAWSGFACSAGCAAEVTPLPSYTISVAGPGLASQ